MKFVWTQLEPSPDPKHGLPCARSSHGISLVQNYKRIILMGGENIARTPLDPDQATWAADREESDVDSWRWRLIAPENAPPLRLAHSQATVGDSVYVFGGRMGIGMGEKALNDMWVLDCAGEAGSEKWEEVFYAGGTPPDPRSFHKMISVGTDLFVFGGCSASGRLADLHRFDTVTNTWHDLGKSDILQGRGGANFLYLESGKCLAVIAGFCGKETNDGHRYTLEDGKGWEDSAMDRLGEMRPRSVCISAYLPSCDMAIIFGGEVDPSDRGHEGAGGFEDDVIVLDGKTGAFMRRVQSSIADSEWPEKRGWSDGAVRDIPPGTSSLFIFGGLSGDDKNPRRLGDLWRCDINI
mmetsp:Transcript_21347/g.43072  ORF Transcript_21347/g.43072 Transcript_21347/m.43072 type:complete len:352 (-) Transcript_21347:83-1138(-)|eukprot:CAMPEP_0183300244 /NCGR_PEP_ID=MMETSP0160_2-20130417/6739_1 /TAXON_ID=2839 ORGANISM="Odontella Sinensis, Strain Grunow 1884" /NCGR_SAMPLE_ID=MMETSP0160_2 /ASSEMBLY_ACC=CAM_ASM_000250 /LENGTH=351 /DNA_ID=CAMNT_0025462631 /DNA_START=51 /DNA_END=1106 /DNA_ORIENTATION=-